MRRWFSAAERGFQLAPEVREGAGVCVGVAVATGDAAARDGAVGDGATVDLAVGRRADVGVGATVGIGASVGGAVVGTGSSGASALLHPTRRIRTIPTDIILNANLDGIVITARPFKC